MSIPLTFISAFPLKFKKNQTTAISIKKYGSDKELPSTFSLWEVYQYSDQMLKHLPKDSLKQYKKLIFIVNSRSISLARSMIEETITRLM